MTQTRAGASLRAPARKNALLTKTKPRCFKQ